MFDSPMHRFKGEKSNPVVTSKDEQVVFAISLYILLDPSSTTPILRNRCLTLFFHLVSREIVPMLESIHESLYFLELISEKILCFINVIRFLSGWFKDFPKDAKGFEFQTLEVVAIEILEDLVVQSYFEKSLKSVLDVVEISNLSNKFYSTKNSLLLFSEVLSYFPKKKEDWLVDLKQVLLERALNGKKKDFDYKILKGVFPPCEVRSLIYYNSSEFKFVCQHLKKVLYMLMELKRPGAEDVLSILNL